MRASPAASVLKEAYGAARAAYHGQPSDELQEAWKTTKSLYKRRKKLEALDKSATKIQAQCRRVLVHGRVVQQRRAEQQDELWEEIRGDMAVRIQSAVRGGAARMLYCDRVREMEMIALLSAREASAAKRVDAAAGVAEEAEPVDQADPAEEAEPVEEAELAEEAEPIEEADPVEEADPAQEADPTDEYDDQSEETGNYGATDEIQMDDVQEKREDEKEKKK